MLHPDELLERLKPAQWKGWLRYLDLSPLPHDRADFAAARHISIWLASMGVEASTLDLLPRWGVPAEELTDEQEDARVSEKLAPRLGPPATIPLALQD